MAEMSDPREPDGSEEENFGGKRLTGKDPGQLCSWRSLPGCLTRAPLLLFLVFISLGFLMLLVTTMVQVSRIDQSLQKETRDDQESHNPVAVAQEQMQSKLEGIRQQLTWMNATLASLCHPCPWNWEVFQGNCYLFSWTQSDWKSAVSACRNIKAQLVIVSSAEEQKFLKFWYVRNNKPTWIGLSDHHNEGSWRWLDNSSLQLSFWKDGEPNNHGDEDCVELHNDGWNDGRCVTEHSWICEKPSTPCPEL
ncbi:CD209 antigen [Camelus dromedarius]|uniref:CD209 antigen n=2 Tax=Camelus TaxID=9836 RepID=A0A8B6Y8Q7_CAMFR|nr:CD209 antigen [Camelus ferus]XP_010965112.1 CD209 antigen-like protein E [Camelus bactrianus]XP_010976557.1 CD209 antigen-like protein E [Camelus dromedarius]